MEIKTNFNLSHQEKLNSLVAKQLVSIIFFQTKPSFSGGHYPSLGRFPSKEQGFWFYGERLALVFKIPDDRNYREIHYEVLSIKNNNRLNRKSPFVREMNPICGIDINFDNFMRGPHNATYSIPEKIDEIELIELANSGINSKIITPYVSFSVSNLRQNVHKIELFGMEESILDKEGIKHINIGEYDYPIDISIVNKLVISLSGSYLSIHGENDITDDGISFYSLNRQEIEANYKEMKRWKNIFNHPVRKLLYTTEI